MTIDDQKKLLDAGFTLARESLGNKVLILNASHECWVSFNVPLPSNNILNPDEREAYVNRKIDEFLKDPKTISV